jgi:hypothetical protein
MQVMSALAALADKEVQLEIHAPGLQVSAGIVEHLGATLGHSLTHLELSACSIPHDFWPAVWRHLTRLQELQVLSTVAGAVSSNDIAASCSQATRPLGLRLQGPLYCERELSSSRHFADSRHTDIRVLLERIR